jgi:hypothetical protein
MPSMPAVIGSAISWLRSLIGLHPIEGTPGDSVALGERIVVTALGPIGHVYLPVVLDPA